MPKVKQRIIRVNVTEILLKIAFVDVKTGPSRRVDCLALHELNYDFLKDTTVRCQPEIIGIKDATTLPE